MLVIGVGEIAARKSSARGGRRCFCDDSPLVNWSAARCWWLTAVLSQSVTTAQFGYFAEVEIGRASCRERV